MDQQAHAPSPIERLDRRSSVAASMTLMPEWARRMTGTRHSQTMDRLVLGPLNQLRAQLIRWAYPEPPCVAMARARVAAESETGAAEAAA